MSEPVAHLALSLLQVLDYVSVDSMPDNGLGSNLPLDVDILDHILKIAQVSDAYLQIFVHTWRVVRLLFCHCREHAVKDRDRCERCRTTVRTAETLVDEELLPLPPLIPVRTRAAMLCLAYVTTLEKTFRPGSNPFTHAANDVFGNSSKGLSKPLMLRDPLKTWFSSPLRLESRMERYVYNVGRYLRLRFCSASCAPVDVEDASTVCMTFKDICGLSEEYRRSTWYWTAELERSGRWQEIQEVLEPLVKQSVEQPSLSWSHERCIVRLVIALVEQDQDERARQLLVDI